VRVFLDANVLVSAFASRGLCAEVFELVLLDHDFVAGRNVLSELERALHEKVKLSALRSAEIVDFVANEAIEIIEDAAPANADADLQDALVIGEALASHAQCFVTGDGALLRLARVDTLEILSPRQFWETLRARR
jgi:putative PIN family toxin of toxin-antitoxin system